MDSRSLLTQGSQRESILECLGNFFKEVIPIETIRSLLIEAEEYVANAIHIKFDFRCDKNLLNEVSATVLYLPPNACKVLVELSLSSQIDAKDFIVRVYPSLISKSCYLEVSKERIYVAKKVSCQRISETDFTNLVGSILREVGESCVLLFSGTYELRWYSGQ